jgi:hypothetical protein
VIDPEERMVRTIAGTGKPGYNGDGGPAAQATFGSDPKAKFDGPISLSLDEGGDMFVGDRFNHVVRLIHRQSRIIETIAGKNIADVKMKNDLAVSDPLNLNLPEISSMDYHEGRLYVPTDLGSDGRDLAVLRRLIGD